MNYLEYKQTVYGMNSRAFCMFIVRFRILVSMLFSSERKYPLKMPTS